MRKKIAGEKSRSGAPDRVTFEKIVNSAQRVYDAGEKDFFAAARAGLNEHGFNGGKTSCQPLFHAVIGRLVGQNFLMGALESAEEEVREAAANDRPLATLAPIRRRVAAKQKRSGG